jgi:hypothetical protein
MASFNESFPNLRNSTYQICSPETRDYNCIGWAVGRNDLFMWPDKYNQMFWPLLCPREETIDAFIAAFRFFGYEPCENDHQEEGFDKIALYAQEGKPKHAARQLANGRWTSKLGQNVDIEHDLLDLEGPKYGQVLMFFHRPSQ